VLQSAVSQAIFFLSMIGLGHASDSSVSVLIGIHIFLWFNTNLDVMFIFTGGVWKEREAYNHLPSPPKKNNSGQVPYI
jgi:hypothetical protein